MLLVRTAVRPSAIHGLGLHAAELIPVGTVICRWREDFARYFTEEERLALPVVARDFLFQHGWRIADGRWCVALDDSRFMNHSFSPNMIVTVTPDCLYESRAAMDVAAGEELTEDYRQFDPDFESYARFWVRS